MSFQILIGITRFASAVMCNGCQLAHHRNKITPFNFTLPLRQIFFCFQLGVHRLYRVSNHLCLVSKLWNRDQLQITWSDHTHAGLFQDPAATKRTEIFDLGVLQNPSRSIVFVHSPAFLGRRTRQTWADFIGQDTQRSPSPLSDSYLHRESY